MAGRRSQNDKPRRRLIPVVAIGATLTLLGGLAVFAEGYDAQEVLPLETSVWVTRDAGQYARVNTDLAEIDTVRDVEEPTGVAQSGSRSVVFAQGYRQLWPVDSANPLDLSEADGAPAAPVESAADGASDAEADAEPSGPQNTPLGTRQVVAGGSYLAYLTDTGSVFVSGFAASDGGSPVAFPVNPFATVVADEGEEPPTYSATAVAVSPSGRVASYSPDEGAIRLFDADTSKFVGDEIVFDDAPASDARLELAMVGERWVLSNPADGLVWADGVDGAIETGLGADTRLQSSSEPADSAYLADGSGLVGIDLESGAVAELASASGVAAAPTVVDGVAYAAWLSTDGGELWTSESDDMVPLQVDGDTLEQEQSIVPAFQSNGQRAVLSEQSSGMIWTVPDGQLIPLSQWDVDEDDQQAGTIQVDDVAQQEPPVAVGDSFGVRTGQLVSLPLLLNDHDPNKKDVLSIAAASVSGLSDGAFGDLGLVSNNQSATVRVRAESGSATFTYAVTDGAAESPPATVTLTVVAPDANSAPVWCGVEACQQDWPTPQVAPGGTIKIPVLAAWVDPEGDAVMLADARKNTVTDPVSVVATADGYVAIRHNDPNAADTTIVITVVVSDARGATAEKELVLSVSSNPALVAAPVALVAGLGEKASITIGDHVSGGSGSYRVVDAVETASTADGLVVVPNAAAGTIEVTASEIGQYLVNYTVQDSTTLAEQSAVLRLTTVAAEAPLTIAPLTAIVRANEDTTVDVLGAVQNTTGRVLIVTDAQSSDPGLSVSVVGQSRIRVSGASADGEPGPIGTASISISDGNNSTVEGQVSVFLVAPTTATNPIAVPDAVTVRAGAQVDIPVLDNDLSPRGERLLVHPQLEGSGTAGELAFAGETNVRYLAPGTPGVYTLRYTTYLEGQPDRIDTADITVTVVAAGANRAPQPRVLSARAIAGQTVEIPVDTYGIDPDGDSVALADVELPPAGQGVSSVSADGTSVVYTAPAAGVSGGQVSFAYTVRDSVGESVNGTVRIGVVANALADVTPITYSDYIRVQRGSGSPVNVSPLLDDRDPAQGELELVSVVPNAPSSADNPEYARLLDLIDPSTSLPKASVALRAGDVVGTQSYIYTVRSSKSTSTAQGLIVVDVTDGAAPDMPVVSDTVITAKDRNKLAAGIDVVSGKVQWATGDASKLKLALWGDASTAFTVSGASISGEAPAGGALVPFTLTGDDSKGDAVEAHGFLRIPAFDDMRIQVRGAVKPVTVDEDKSVDFAVRELLDLESADSVEIRSDSGFIVQRTNASCAASSSTKAVYKAGREAPWVDTCTVPVRLTGQTAWTSISVPINILPNDPRAILSSITRTIAPGTTENLDLYANATTWEGGREGDTKLLDYATLFTGSSFIVSQTGASVSIEARADARPGTRESIQVTVSNFGGLVSSVTLVVGVAPVDSPRGATFSQQCDATKSASCAITVIGVAGEYDPFAGKPGAGLTVVKVGSGSTMSCPVANVSVSSATQIVATWPGARPPGGTCVVPITVKDAQGRTGAGQVTVDVLSYPQAPTTVTTTGYSGTSVTLTVPLGEAAQAHPSVNGVVIFEAGVAVPTASCSPGGPAAYTCVVSGLVNGERHIYTARTSNAVGQSLDTNPVETWAYRAPVISSLTAIPVYDRSTTRDVAVIEVAIAASDDAKSFRVSVDGQTVSVDVDRRGTTTTKMPVVPGQRQVDVVPISSFLPPIGNTGNEGAQTSTQVLAAGAPFFTSNGSASPTGTTVTLNGVGMSANSSTLRTDITYVLWEGQQPGCNMSQNFDVYISGNYVATSKTGTFANQEPNKVYQVKACGTNGYGVASTDPVSTTTFTSPGAPSGNLSYTISATASVGANGTEYTFAKTADPAVNTPNGFTTFYLIGNQRYTSLPLQHGVVPPAIEVQNCWNVNPAYCGTKSAIGFVNAKTSVTVKFPTAACVADPKASEVTGIPNGAATVTATIDAVENEAVYKVVWNNTDFAGLTDIEYRRPICAVVPPAPAPSDPGTAPTGG